MRVITKGIVQEYRCQCSQCKTVFVFTAAEAFGVSRSFDSFVRFDVKCPVCDFAENCPAVKHVTMESVPQ